MWDVGSRCRPLIADVGLWDSDVGRWEPIWDGGSRCGTSGADVGRWKPIRYRWSFRYGRLKPMWAGWSRYGRRETMRAGGSRYGP
ncbi:unnamed protein product [Sphagnum compactum]